MLWWSHPLRRARALPRAPAARVCPGQPTTAVTAAAGPKGVGEAETEKEVGVGLRGRRRAETEEDGVGRLRLPDSLARKETATQTATQAASRRQRRAEAATQGRAATQGGGGDAPAALGGRELAFREELPSPKLPACEWPVRITHDAVRRRSPSVCRPM